MIASAAVTVRSARLGLTFVVLVAGLSRSTASLAQAHADSAPATTSAKVAKDAEETLPAYHHSYFSWEHSVTAATLGVGDRPQSYNPTYTMGLVARTRYYLLDDAAAGKHFSLRLDTGLYTELTNNDYTTERGEWSFSDTSFGGVYAQRFLGTSNRNGTLWEVRPLNLSLPTSKVSFSSGRYIGLGAVVAINDIRPWLQGTGAPEVVSTLRLALGYQRNFARATVPTNPSLERVRLTTDGRALPGDTLSGSSLVRDQLEVNGRMRFEIGSRILWTTDAAFAPAWKYDVPRDVQLCGVVQTGCVDLELAPDDSRYLVRTQFNTEVSLRLGKGFSVELGYGNLSYQLGPDGSRRSFFYSPQAVFYTSLSFFPHELAAPSESTNRRPAAGTSAPSAL